MSAVGDFAGLVLDLEGVPVEGAMVTLTPLDPPGETESVAESNLFGSFALTSLLAGTYALDVSHPAYEPREPEAVEVTDGLERSLVVTLVPKAGGPYFDVTVEVADVTSNLPLGDVPVRLWAFATADSVEPVGHDTVATDSHGLATFRGVEAGFYRVTANRDDDASVGTVRAYWEGYSTEASGNDRRHLTRPHLARVLLKHRPQALTVLVRGYRPTTDQNNQPLAGMTVELTGVDPDDPTRVVIPRRSGVTGDDGRILFTDLPAIPYEVRVKRLGYAPRGLRVDPASDGTLPTGDVLATVQAEATLLLVDLVDDFTDPLYWVNGTVMLTGLPGTNTAGITRSSNFSYNFPNTTVGVWDKRHFFGLLPGPYRMTFQGRVAGDQYHGTPNTPDDRRPIFRLDEVIDVPAIPQAGLNLAALPHLAVHAEATPALVRGRVWVAEGTADVANDGVGPVPFYAPVYQILPAREGDAVRVAVELREYSADGLLLPERRVQVVEVDVNGEFALAVLPGRYGVRVLEASEYWGSHVQLDHLGTGVSRRQGWPFWQVWPYGATPPTHGTGQPGLPLVLLSGASYQLDLFLHRKQVEVVHRLDDDPDDPVRVLVLAGTEAPFSDLYSDELVAELGNGVVSLPGSAGAPPGHVRHRGVGPGSWSLALAHPRNSFAVTAGSGSVEIPDWPDAGDLPTTNPGPSPILPLQVVMGERWQATFAASNTTITLVVRVWREDLAGDPPVATWQYGPPSEIVLEDAGDFFQFSPDYAPAGLVLSGGDKMPPGSFRFWNQLSSGQEFTAVASPGDNVIEVYRAVSGYEGAPNPPLNVLTSFPPGSPYTLQLVAANVEDPTQLVDGTTIVVGGETLAANVSYPNRTGSLAPGVTANARWQVVGGAQRLVSIDPLVVEISRWLARGLAVAGQVRGLGGGGPEPLAGATVRLFDRRGATLLGGATSGANGAFELASAVPRAQPMWVEVTAPGYVPWRQRRSSDEATDPGSGELELFLNVDLEPLPGPTEVALSRDRHGLFLPGVSRAGDASVGNYLVAEEPLTLTWSVTGQAAVVTIPASVFDDADGTSGAADTVAVVDPITEAWLVDVRRFSGHPFSAVPETVPPPVAGGRVALAAWLESVRQGTGGTTFHQRVDTPERLTDGTLVLSGRLPLWKLPPGPFEPVVVLVSERGGISVHPTFINDTPAHRLYGAQVPPWLAQATGALASISSLQASAAQVDGYFPLGQFNALPAFGATIEVDANAFLNYTYGMDLGWAEGVETPDSGLLMFAPGMIGVNFSARAEFGSDGSDGQVFFRASTEAANESQPLRPAMLPKFARGLEPTGALTVGASTEFRRFFDAGVSANEIEFETTVGADFEMSASRPLGLTVAKRVPSVGLVLVALEKAGTFTLTAETTAGVGLEISRLRATAFPPARETTSTGDLDHVYERDLFGGQGARTLETTPTLSLRFDVGLKADFAGRATAQASLQMTGEENANGKPSASVTFNPVGDWPPISRVQGAFTATVAAQLDAWVATFEKEWTFELVTFDHQFGTQSEFSWTPMTITTRRLTPAQHSPATLIGSGPVLVDDFAPDGRVVAVAGSSLDAMLYTDAVPSSGEVVLRLSHRTDGGFGAPVELHRGAAIVAMDLAEVAPGQWRAIWSRLGADQIGSTRPLSSLWTATSNDGVTWSGPSLITALPGVAVAVRWVSTPDGGGVLLQQSRGGPLASHTDLLWVALTGGSWAAPLTLEDHRPIVGWATTGNTPNRPTPALLVWSESDGLLRVRPGDGLAWQEASVIATGVGAALHAAPVADSPAALAITYGLSAGGVAVRVWTGGSAGPEIEVLSGVAAGQVYLDRREQAEGPPRHLLVWTAGATAPALWMAWLDSGFGLEVAPQHLSRQAQGGVSHFSVLPENAAAARVVAREVTPAGAQVREYRIGLPPPAPILGRPLLLAGGGLDLPVRVNPGQTYQLEVSDDLQTWYILRTLVPLLPEFIVTDETGALDETRFYRLVGPLP